ALAANAGPPPRSGTGGIDDDQLARRKLPVELPKNLRWRRQLVGADADRHDARFRGTLDRPRAEHDTRAQCRRVNPTRIQPMRRGAPVPMMRDLRAIRVSGSQS